MSRTLFCVNCDSENISTKRVPYYFSLPMGDQFSYEKEVHVCEDCKEEGVFLRKTSKENHERYLVALKEANKESLEPILDDLAEWDYSMAYIERALRLPQRTISRWKGKDDPNKGGISAAGIALLRTIHTYPWILKVADEDFEESFAIGELVQQAGNIFKKHGRVEWKSSPYDISLTATMSKPIDITFNETYSPPRKAIGSEYNQIEMVIR